MGGRAMLGFGLAAMAAMGGLLVALGVVPMTRENLGVLIVVVAVSRLC